jgi:phosphatidylglycerophosphate synthase
MVGDSWTHKAARWCILPLVDTAVTPNHLTIVRLITGIAACAMFASGMRELEIWGGWMWLLSAFLDRADGELARVSGKTSQAGHRFDYFCDATVTSAFFVGIGLGLIHGTWGVWSAAMGLVAGGAVLIAEILAERIDQSLKDTGEKAFEGFAGFDFDDVLYLFAPVVWLGWHPYFLAGATLGAPAFAWVTYRKYRAGSNRS